MTIRPLYKGIAFKVRIESNKFFPRFFDSFSRINGTAAAENPNVSILRNSDGSVRKFLFEIFRSFYFHSNVFLRLLTGYFLSTDYLGNETNKPLLTNNVISDSILSHNISLELNHRIRPIDTSHFEEVLVVLTRKLFIDDAAISKDHSKVVPGSYTGTNRIMAFDNENVPLILLPPWKHVLNWEHKQICFYCLTFISVYVTQYINLSNKSQGIMK